MPRVRKRSKSRRSHYTEWHVRQLIEGHDLFGNIAFGNDEDMDIEAIKVAWGVLRDKIMADYTRENPGCRPWCWWFVESPEPRQRVDGILHPFKDRLRKARFDAMPDHWYVKRHANDLFFGLPRINLTDEERSAKYETEPQYLLRLDLLTKAERDELFPTMEK